MLTIETNISMFSEKEEYFPDRKQPCRKNYFNFRKEENQKVRESITLKNVCL